jgi:hypothetical protein
MARKKNDGESKVTAPKSAKPFSLARANSMVDSGDITLVFMGVLSQQTQLGASPCILVFAIVPLVPPKMIEQKLSVVSGLDCSISCGFDRYEIHDFQAMKQIER